MYCPIKRNSKLLFFRILLFAICSVFISSFSYGKDDNFTVFFIDNDKDSISLEQFIEAGKQAKLQSADHVINLGFESSQIWVKIEKDSSLQNQILVLTNAHLDVLDIYYYSGDKRVKKEHSGDHLSFASRFSDNIFFNFLIPSGVDAIYLQVKTEGPMLVPIKLLSYSAFVHYVFKNELFHFVYFGIIILTLLTSIFMFFWLKDSISIYYSIYLFTLAFITALDFGYGFQLLWPENPEINKYNTIFYCLSFSTLLFSEKLLNLKENSRILFKIYRAFYLVFFLTAIAGFFIPYSILVRFIFLVTLFIPLLSFFSGIYLYTIVRNEYTKFYMYGWAVFMVSIVFYMLSVSGIIPNGQLATNMIQIGSSIEIIFFNLAVLSRLGLLQKEKQDILSEQNLILEQKVTERTIQLEEKNEIIEQNNKLLQDHKNHLEQLVEERTKDLTDKNQRLEHFADLTHHNLRGPVATLLGLCKIYNSHDPADPFNRVVFDNLCQTVTNMDNIVRNLGQLLNTEKEISSMMVPVNLAATLNEVKTMLDAQIIKSGAVIEEDFRLATELNSVPAYLDNIFFQLLSNSIKYGKYETLPHIKIKSYKKDEHLFLEFKDNGMGIDIERFRDQLFKPFKRFHTTSDGRGLGLSIVKRQVEVMGGEIDLISSLGDGTTILIKFKISS